MPERQKMFLGTFLYFLGTVKWGLFAVLAYAVVAKRGWDRTAYARSDYYTIGDRTISEYYTIGVDF